MSEPTQREASEAVDTYMKEARLDRAEDLLLRLGQRVVMLEEMLPGFSAAVEECNGKVTLLAESTQRLDLDFEHLRSEFLGRIRQLESPRKKKRWWQKRLQLRVH